MSGRPSSMSPTRIVPDQIAETASKKSPGRGSSRDRTTPLRVESLVRQGLAHQLANGCNVKGAQGRGLRDAPAAVLETTVAATVDCHLGLALDWQGLT